MAQTQSYFDGEEKYAHLEKKDVEGVVEKVALAQKWLDDMMAKQAEREKWRDPAVKSSDIKKRREELVFAANPVMTRPKPKPPVEQPSPAPGSGTQTPGGGQQTQGQGDAPMGESAQKEAAPEPSNMDVD